MTDLTEIRLSRYFDAPPAEVYAAFVEPEQLAQWFGPLAYHCPVGDISVDARPGGHWRITMVANDDHEQRNPLDTTLIEVVPDELLVGYDTVTHFPGLPDGSTVTLSVEFRPEGRGTRLELRQGPFPDMIVGHATAGWGQSFHKLDGLLASPAQFRPGSSG
jgi:uncharacterized protein YndB with AHSA1/START domain